MQITIEDFQEELDAEIVTANFFPQFIEMYQDECVTCIQWYKYLTGFMLREIPKYERGTLMEG